MFIEPEKEGDPFKVSDADTMLDYLNPNAQKPGPGRDPDPRRLPDCARAKKRAARRQASITRDPAGAHDPHQGARARSPMRKTVPQVFINGGLIGGGRRPRAVPEEGRLTGGRDQRRHACTPLARRAADVACPVTSRTLSEAREWTMNSTFDTDVAVIGAGTAGLAAYRAAKAAGKRAVMIERRRLRHDLRARGLHAEQAADRAGRSRPPRSSAARVRHVASTRRSQVDGKAVMARVRRERDRFVGFVLRGVDEIPGADKAPGYARFVDDHTLVDLDDGGDRIVSEGASSSRPARRRSYPADLAGARRPPRHERRRVRVGRPAGERGGVRPRRHRARARTGAASARRAREGLRPRRRRRSARRSRRSSPKRASVFGAEFYLDTDAHADVQRDGDEVVVAYRGARRHATRPSASTTCSPRPAARRTCAAHRAREHVARAATRTACPLFDRDDAAVRHVVDLHRRRRQQRRAAAARGGGRRAHRRRRTRRASRPCGKGLRRARLGVMFTDPQIAIVGGGYRARAGVARTSSARCRSRTRAARA